ncbi:MAG TPA: type II toxin-antitoxin system prevent-host-death family antitoxin [Dissulfurispiraceae bacterium]
MESVGIRELKAKLSSYIGRVCNGEQVVVTEHGEEVAVIVPVSKERRAVNALAASGKARWSGGKPKGCKGVEVKGKPLSETVLEERR